MPERWGWFRRARGEFWRATMIEPETRLRAARGVGKSETEASIEVFQTPKRRGHPNAPPPTVSDGRGGIREAMVEVYGKVPEYAGIGRPPTGKRPGENWQYLQVIKQRENGRVVGIRLRVVYGDKEDVLHICDLVRPLKTLRLKVADDPQRRWLSRTPAMAAGLTDHFGLLKSYRLSCPSLLATLNRETTEISFPLNGMPGAMKASHEEAGAQGRGVQVPIRRVPICLRARSRYNGVVPKDGRKEGLCPAGWVGRRRR